MTMRTLADLTGAPGLGRRDRQTKDHGIRTLGLSFTSMRYARHVRIRAHFEAQV